MQLEIEREALRKETDRDAARGWKALNRNSSGCKRSCRTHRAQWEAGKSRDREATRAAQQIEQIKDEIEKAERAYDLTRVAELQYGELPPWSGSSKSRKRPPVTRARGDS